MQILEKFNNLSDSQNSSIETNTNEGPFFSVFIKKEKKKQDKN